jgi:hypothetical protein
MPRLINARSATVMDSPMVPTLKVITSGRSSKCLFRDNDRSSQRYGARVVGQFEDSLSFIVSDAKQDAP